MLKKFDSFCENVLIEGRTADDKKQFKVNIDKVKKCCNEIGEKHNHYRNDKSHFLDIAEELNSNTIYTPKTFMEHVKSIMKGFGKSNIADGYGKLLYAFLKDRMDSPLEDYKKDEESKEEEKSSEEDEKTSYDSILPDASDSETQTSV